MEKLTQEMWDSKFESHSEIPVLLWGKDVRPPLKFGHKFKFQIIMS